MNLNSATRRDLERQRDARLKLAEERSGFRQGGFVRNGRIVSITVTFHPVETWWIEPSGEEKTRLTPEIWAECSKLKL